jgi:hypothetical protein
MEMDDFLPSGLKGQRAEQARSWDSDLVLQLPGAWAFYVPVEDAVLWPRNGCASGLRRVKGNRVS